MAGWSAFGLSDIGHSRARNEDAFAIADDLGCVLVADGLGGHSGGDVASRLARDTVVATLGDARRELAGGGAGAALSRAMDAANLAVARAADADPALAGMGTTLTVLWLHPAAAAAGGASTGWVAHAGDSRVYRLGPGGLVQLTEDHNLAWEMMRAGSLSPSDAARSLLSNRLTRAVGIDECLEADVFAVEAAGAEAFLLCSDGLTGMVDDAAIEHGLRAHAGAPQAACRALVDAALANGGRDNVTVVVLCPGDG